MPEIREEIEREEKERKEKEEREKKLRKVEAEKVPEKTYEPISVDAIVKKMREKYEERGITVTEEKGKAATLKEMVAGREVLALDQRKPAELITSKKGFLRFVGRIFSIFHFLNASVERVFNWNITRNLMNDLDSANMNYSVKQYIGICLVESYLVAFFFALFSIPIIFLFFGESITTALIGITLSLGISPYLQILSILVQLLLVGIIGVFVFYITLLIALKYPSSKASQRGRAIDKDLPFALRHMATEVRAGIGIHTSMKSIVEAKYGVLSDEFDRTIKDIERGMSTEDALEALAGRSPSDGLSRSTLHIIRALKTGGDLSSIIETIAKDVAFDLRMKMRDFVERLNLIGLFYMMVGIVFPVFIAVLAGIFNAIPTIGMPGILGVEVLFLVYFLLIPMALGLILYVIKVMQPM